MKSCPFCGRAIDDDAIYCSGCGREIDAHDEITHNPITEAMLHYDEMPEPETRRKHGIVRCPRCGEHNLHPMNETSTSVQTSGGGYSSSKGCLGWLLFGPIGLLCGGLGQKQRTSVNTVNKLFWICNECGFKFRNLDDWAKEIDIKEKQQKLNQYSAIALVVLSLLFMMMGGGMELLGILFLAIAAMNGILAFTLIQIIKRERTDYEKLRDESLE